MRHDATLDRPPYRDRIAALAGGVLAKVARTAAALRPDAEDRARRHLDRLVPTLAALPAGPRHGSGPA
jgi:hypothetical protein